MDDGIRNNPSSTAAEPPETGNANQPNERSSASDDPVRPAGSASGRTSPESGQVFGNRYRLIEQLGKGGMGSVWRARDEVMDRDVAVKEPFLPDDLTEKEKDLVLARLEREARAAAQIDHPSVVVIHDVVSGNGRPWIVMELIRGRPLAGVLNEGTLTPAEAARIMLPVVQALAAAHDRKILHRDVKPENIMLGAADRIVLTDFGIARIEREEALTATDILVGSPEYMAPERVSGQVPGPASDLFSVGVVLYIATEGHSPFRRKVSHATLQAVLNATPPKLTQAGELEDIIMRLLSKKPQNRPATRETIAVLEEVAKQSEPSRLLTGRPRRGREWARSAGLALAASVVTGVLVAVVMWPGGSGTTIPQDWKSHEVLGAHIALPSNYTASSGSDNAAFRVQEGQVDQQFLLHRGDTKMAGTANTVPARAANAYEYPKSLDHWNRTLSEEVVNGLPARLLTMTFRSEDGTELWRKKELYYTDDNGEKWTLIFDSEINHEYETKGDQLFEQAVRTIKPA